METNLEMPLFNVGEPVVYPQQGLGIVKNIQSRTRNGEEVSYYDIYLSSSEMDVMIPVKKAGELGIRPIVSSEEALGAISGMSNKPQRSPQDWKVRYQQNLGLLKSGKIEAIAKVVETLYHRSKIKELPIQERKLYDSALELLVGETVHATGKSEGEVQSLILSRLER